MLIALLGIVSALVVLLCCAARFGVSKQAIIAEHEQIDHEAAVAERDELAA